MGLGMADAVRRRTIVTNIILVLMIVQAPKEVLNCAFASRACSVCACLTPPLSGVLGRVEGFSGCVFILACFLGRCLCSSGLFLILFWYCSATVLLGVVSRFLFFFHATRMLNFSIDGVFSYHVSCSDAHARCVCLWFGSCA